VVLNYAVGRSPDCVPIRTAPGLKEKTGRETMFRWNPEDYLHHSGEQEKWARELIPKIGLKGDERVLDVGCGDGKVTAEIARFCIDGTVLGIDSSPEMIEFARNAFMDAFRNLAFHCTDVREMHFTREFDIVFSNAALHWVKDHEPVLKRIKQALRPGGRAVLQMAGEGNAATVLETVNTVINKERWLPYFEDFAFPYAFHGATEYAGLVAEAGLALKRIEMIPKDMTQNGTEGLAGWIRTTWLPYVQRVPIEMQDRFIEDVVSRYEQCHPAQDGLFHIAMTRLEVEAVREQ
jgi:trans-aconitate 2-methyltransferase